MFVFSYFVVFVGLSFCIFVFSYFFVFVGLCFRMFVFSFVCVFICLCFRMFVFSYVCVFIQGVPKKWSFRSLANLDFHRCIFDQKMGSYYPDNLLACSWVSPECSPPDVILF